MFHDTLTLARTTADPTGLEITLAAVPADAITLGAILLGLPLAAALGIAGLLSVIHLGVRLLEAPRAVRRRARHALPAVGIAAVAALLWGYGPLVSATAVGIGHVLSVRLR